MWLFVGGSIRTVFSLLALIRLENKTKQLTDLFTLVQSHQERFRNTGILTAYERQLFNGNMSHLDGHW